MAATEEVKRTDYSRSFQGAEEAASLAVDAILTEGGTVLWRKYLEKKAFVFAEESATGAAVAHLEMCFVAHDEGEEAMEETWAIEEEPQPYEIDSWARMHLPTRRRIAGEDDAQTQMPRRNPRRNTRPQMAVNRRRPERTNYRSEQRMFALPEDAPIEEEEERLRREKTEEKQRLVEKEHVARQAEKDDKAQANKIIALHEEMDRRPHTFDTDGGIIWIEEPKPEKLPKFQEMFPFNVKRDNARRTMDAAQLAQSLMSQNSPDKNADSSKTRKKAQDRKNKNKKGDTHGADFTDFFAKLQDGQPPILETMLVKAGVTLEAQGQKAIGPDLPDQRRTMSRKEYVQHAEKELAGEGGTSVSGGGSKAPQAYSTDSPGPGAPIGVGGGATDESAGGGGASLGDASAAGVAGGGLPPINQGRSGQGALGSTQRTGGAGQGMSRPDGAGVQPMDASRLKGLIPPVTPRSRYRTKYDAIGNLPRPPRYHQPSLGGCSFYKVDNFSSTGNAQPPIGATMGHGLVHSGSLKESFFYPSQTPVLPPALLRAASEGVLRRENSTGSQGGDTPKNTPGRSARGRVGRAFEKEVDEFHGMIKGPDGTGKKSQIYRNVLNSMTER
jgi:hypothetical protein